MHNIKDIRKDFDNFKNKLKNRNIDTDLDSIIGLGIPLLILYELSIISVGIIEKKLEEKNAQY